MKSFLKKIVVWILALEARFVLYRYKPEVVAVTGSVGKTGTKDAIYSVLKSVKKVRKSEKSFNSEVGVPLTVLGLPNAWSSLFGWAENIADGLLLMLFKQEYPEWLVLEVGADHPGDIASLARWFRPATVVLTRFPEVPVHVEFFGSREAVIEEKRHLRRALRENGTLIVNADDELLVEEPVGPLQRRLTYGFGAHADVRASRPLVRYEKGVPQGISCTVTFQDHSHELYLKDTLGTHQLYALLAGITVGVSEGMTLEHTIDALEGHAAPPGRMRILAGVEGSVLIDDTYNSSPIAAGAAVEALGKLKCSGRRIAVLGDMMELGEFSVEEHQKLGRAVAAYADVFVSVGVRMKAAAAAARAAGMSEDTVAVLPDSRKAAEALRDIVGKGDVVLLKGSQSTRMERAVEALLRNPGIDKSLLVRQDVEWKSRPSAPPN